MTRFIAIALCKLLRLITKKINKNSSLPGKVALFICPRILSRIKFPDHIIAVLGSDGKSTTAEMINKVLETSNVEVAYSRDYENTLEGAATLILSNSDLFGRFERDILLLEADEMQAKNIFKYFAPTYIVVTNILRDKMTKNGHPEYVLSQMNKAIRKESTLVLNADDPLTASLARKYNNVTYYYGLDDNQYVSEDCDSMYNDGYYCPVCKSKMTYAYHQFAHMGKYECTKCDYKREDTDFTITEINLKNRYIVIDKKNKINLAFDSIYYSYNLLAAYSVCRLIGFKPKTICDVLNNYMYENGCVKNFVTGTKPGTLLISKHEDSLSYDQNLKYIANYKGDASVLLLVDTIDKKFACDTSWLWDINFGLLKAKNVKQIVIGGKYANDVALRLEYCGVDMNKVVVRKGIDIANYYMRFKAIGYIFVLTCFIDEHKYLETVRRI